MRRRYLYGPVRSEWVEAHLPEAVREGLCVPFGPDDSWESALARQPDNPTTRQPDLIAAYLPYAAVPD